MRTTTEMMLVPHLRNLLITLCLVVLSATVYLFEPAAAQDKSGQNSSASTQQKQESNKKKDDKDNSQEQENQETLRLGTELVNLFFSVTDRQNRFITDIQQDEIRILEDGKPQEIFSFQHETDLPLTLAILIDVSGSQEYTLPEEKMAAARFLRSVVRPVKDLAAIVTFRGEVDLMQPLTSNKSRLERALEEVRYIPQTSTDINSKFASTALYDAIYLTAEEVLNREAGRRAIILLTDGEDTSSTYKLDEAIQRAWRSEVIIYAIGIGDRFRFGVDEGTLKRICRETGGRAYFPKNDSDLNRAFAQIEQELRSQYLVAYQPSNPLHDGSFRRVEVQITTRKDLHVTHRRGYYAPKGEKAEVK